MIHLYIDTNIYLTFYHLTSDDLEELKKLQVLLNSNKIRLHLPEQTFDEFNRNREIKIADALKRFREEKLNNQFPQIIKEFPEYHKLKEAIKEFDKNKSILIDKLNDDIFSNNLSADKIIKQLFESSKLHKLTKELLNSAKERFDLGRPPGKNKSYGDALNWETLLKSIPNANDLYFVSDDKDYYSEINNNYFNSYLLEEWKELKNSKIIYFRRISDFFKDKYPDIKIASEFEKEILIKNLFEASSFASARSTLNKLVKFEDFSTQQINDFIHACNSNNQIYWIKSDEDIKEMILKIVTPNKDKIEPSLFNEFEYIYTY